MVEGEEIWQDPDMHMFEMGEREYLTPQHKDSKAKALLEVEI
jgi:hypothetical protein